MPGYRVDSGGTEYPIAITDVAVDYDEYADELNLSEAEAREYLSVLEDALKELDAATSVVQVRFDGYSRRTYAYRDPSDSLVVGDRVIVDTSYGGEQEVEVVGHGRGEYEGGLRNVIAKVVSERVYL